MSESLGRPQTKDETPTMTGAVQALVQTALLELNTCTPAQVESYDALTGTISAQPTIKRKYVKDDEVVNLPIINRVPVAFPRAGQAAITFPLKKGDTVLLVFSQRSIDRWKAQGGLVEAGDPRHHALSDAVAIPGVYPLTDPLIGASADGLVLQNTVASKVTIKEDSFEAKIGAAKMGITALGKFTLGNGVVELLDILDKTLDALLLLTVPTGVGPSGTPINAASFLEQKTKLGLIKE